MSFSEIFKKSFLEGFTSTDINVYTAAVAMATVSAIALYIFVVYRVLTRKTFYSKNFNITLAGIALTTTAIILSIQSSIVVSLGMVGALSIVRFRTSVKDPMDLMFLFWSIAVGIICGVGLAELAILLSIFMTGAIVVLDHLPVAKASMILLVNSEDIKAEKQIMDIVKRHTRFSTVKSRNITKTSLDLIVELRTETGSELVLELLELDAVASANLMTHDGEVTF